MADTQAKHDTVNKELVAVVGHIKNNGPHVVAQSALVISEDMITVLSELKRILKIAEGWPNMPLSPDELVVKNSVEYAVLVKLRADNQEALDAQAAKLAKKSRRT